MALKIKNNKIVGTIDNLEDKLNGEIPVTREELLVLVNSWGRKLGFATKDSQNKDIYIGSCETKECYKLSKLNVTKITNMVDVFIYSLFEGDISEWNTSNVTNMDYMFYQATNFNSNIGNWDVSNVTKMDYMFNNAEKFNQNISSWKLDNIKSSYSMFNKAKAFEKEFL
jgi:surface protein